MTLPFPVAQRLFPVEHHFLDLDATRIHYVTAGSGETVLLLHGNPSWSRLHGHWARPQSAPAEDAIDLE